MELLNTLGSTFRDVLPIAGILIFFQVAVLRQRPPNLRRIAGGFALVLVGLALFLIGLEQALFPIGETMAQQLTTPERVGLGSAGGEVDWRNYWLVYVFAAAIGFAATVAEPALIAVALKAEEVSGGTIRSWGLRLAVAVGVAVRGVLGMFPHSDRHPAALVHHRSLRHSHRPDFPVRQDHRPLGLRQRGSYDLHRDGSGSGGLGTGTGGQHPGSQPPDRRVRADCFRQRLSYNVGTWLRHGGIVVD